MRRCMRCTGERSTCTCLPLKESPHFHESESSGTERWSYPHCTCADHYSTIQQKAYSAERERRPRPHRCSARPPAHVQHPSLVASRPLFRARPVAASLPNALAYPIRSVCNKPPVTDCSFVCTLRRALQRLGLRLLIACFCLDR